MMGIPTALHESNAVPGVAVRLLEKRVDKIFVNFESTIAALSHPEKAVRVGNPLRSDFSGADPGGRPQAVRPVRGISIFHPLLRGSLGAEKINDMALRLMKDYTAHHPEIYHLHACGSIEKEACFAEFKRLGLDQFSNLELVEYIYDMPQRMAAADLIIGRAGAMTLSELALQKKPCVLIPSPNVTNNHQFKNANALAAKGAAVVFEEKDLTGEKLIGAVSGLLADEKRLQAMAKAIGCFAVPDSKKRIYGELCALVKSKKR